MKIKSHIGVLGAIGILFYIPAFAIGLAACFSKVPANFVFIGVTCMAVSVVFLVADDCLQQREKKMAKKQLTGADADRIMLT